MSRIATNHSIFASWHGMNALAPDAPVHDWRIVLRHGRDDTGRIAWGDGMSGRQSGRAVSILLQLTSLIGLCGMVALEHK